MFYTFLRSFSQFISYLFHPLLILTYMILLLLIINPYAFGINQIGEGRSGLIIIYVFLTTFMIPGIAISMMKTLGLIKSLNSDDRRDRIGPFIATAVFYTWLYVSFNQNPDFPVLFKSAILGGTIALFASFIINIFSDISIHTVGMGSLVGLVLISMMMFGYGNFQIGNKVFSMYFLLFLVIIFGGLVGTARMVLKKHQHADLYGGYIVGFASQLIALQIMV